MKALIIGGTGPTGPAIVRGLVERRYEVTVYHTGKHEVDDLPPVQHLHGNPFEPEEIKKDLGSAEWDAVCSMYGRLRFLADALAGRCSRFIGIGGSAGNVAPELLPFPQGRGLPITEEYPRYAERLPGREVGFAVAETERGVLAHHDRGDFSATMLRYCSLYGPRVTRQWLWPVVRRILDRRPFVLLPGDRPNLFPVCYAENAAAQVLLALERPEAAGQVFHAADQETYLIEDVIRIVGEELGYVPEVVHVAHPLAARLASGYIREGSGAYMLDMGKMTWLLGYREPVEPAEGIRRTARWLSENRTDLNEAELTRNPFAYEAEDRLVASYRQWAGETERDLAGIVPERQQR